jgi:trk system potassium uptake protein TrkH
MRRRIPPPVLLAGTLLLIIGLGSLLLRLPAAQNGSRLGWIDTVFTATSAACVTGLVVADTGTQFTPFGQAVLLVLMQFGGIGVMTIGTIVILALGRRPPPAMRAILRTLTAHRPALRPRDVLSMVVLTTATVETAGALLLFVGFARTHTVGEAAWLAAFHSVSAFCNAGFALWPDSFSRYASDPLINLTIMSLIVAGNLGFVVVVEVRQWAISRIRRAGSYVRLSLHSKIVLSGSVIAIFGGALVFLVLEAGNALSRRSFGERLLIATFQSVTTRTAGFNTVDIGALTNPTLLAFIALMFVGAGPGSMAGGIKLTSAAVVLTLVWQRLRGLPEVRLFGRSIGEPTLQRAVVLAFLASLLVGLAIVAIELVQTKGPLDPQSRGELFGVTFEVVSAFGTVGLSMGITAALAPLGKVVIILLMFAGRLGPLALMDFFEHLPPPPPVRYAKEEMVIG